MCILSLTRGLSSYHVARYHFVRKSLQSGTPRHLARHGDPGWKVPA
jgi:putative two-component system hydrogenase maturation factor HypX/HoxX